MNVSGIDLQEVVAFMALPEEVEFLVGIWHVQEDDPEHKGWFHRIKAAPKVLAEPLCDIALLKEREGERERERQTAFAVSKHVLSAIEGLSWLWLYCSTSTDFGLVSIGGTVDRSTQNPGPPIAIFPAALIRTTFIVGTSTTIVTIVPACLLNSCDYQYLFCHSCHP